MESGAIELRDRWAGRNVFSRLTVKPPNLMPLVLQASVAALVNVQSVEAVDGEIRRRAVMGN